MSILLLCLDAHVSKAYGSWFMYHSLLLLLLKLLLHPGIDSLANLLDFLTNFNDWRDLGLKLGLLETTLDNIKANHSSSDDCKRGMLAAWLNWRDNVDTSKYGKPSWARLQNALKKLNLPLANSMEVTTPWE